MPKLKMQGATPIGPPLCDTCRWAQRLQGFSISQEQTRCDFYGRVTFPVHKCSRFLEAGQLSVQEMDSIAWILEKDKKSGHIGFKSATELQREGRWSTTPQWPAKT